MIHYDLRCRNDHRFDGWFRDSAAFDCQASAGLVECPTCGETAVQRALMAPSLRRKGRPAEPKDPVPVAPPPTPPASAVVAGPLAPAVPPEAGSALAGKLPDQVRAALQRLRAVVEKNCDYVGVDFAEEARRMHRGESDRRGIYGETSPERAEALLDEGIEVSSIPWLPRADG